MGFLMFTSIEIVLFIINSCTNFKEKREKYFAVGLMFFVMFVFAAIRGSGDGDYFNYLWFVYDIGKDFSKVINFNYPVEFAFRVFAYLINIFDLSRQWIIVIMNFLSLLPTAFFVAKKSENPFLSAIIFLPIFIQFDMQTSRTATAIGLSLMSIYFNGQRKYIRSILFLLFAISFHRSAMIVVPFLIIMHIKVGNLFMIITSALAFVMSLFSSRVLGFASRILSAAGLSRMATKITSYTFSGRFASSMSLTDPRILFAFLLFVTCIMYYRKSDLEKLEMKDISIKAMWFSLVVLLVFRSSTAIAFRFSTFFTIFQVFYIPMLIKDIRNFDRLGEFLVNLSVLAFVIPYALYLMYGSPAYEFFFTSLQAIAALKN